MDFILGHGPVDQIFTLAALLKVSWEFARKIYMCFVYYGPTTLSPGEFCVGHFGFQEI